MIILPFLIGMLLGAGILYLVLKKRIEQSATTELELKQLRQALTDAEEAHQLRLKEAIATLQSDYQEKNKGNLKALSEKYEAKLYSLEQQLRAVATQNKTQAATQNAGAIADKLPEGTPKENKENSFETATFAPPILAANIIYLTPIPAIPTSIPTGKAIDPPILAQFAKDIVPSVIAPMVVNSVTSFEPPILAATITYLQIQPPKPISTPTGKMINPPILAQT